MCKNESLAEKSILPGGDSKPHLEMEHLKLEIFFKGPYTIFWPSKKLDQTLPRGNCNPHLENGRLQMGHFETPSFQCSELQRLA